MLIIHPTKKVVNLARIILPDNNAGLVDYGMLNEWYVDIVGLGRPGKNALLFVHRTTYITLIVPGNSLLTSIPIFKMRLKKLLKRYRTDDKLIERIYTSFDNVVLSKTNDRKTLGVINQVKLEINTLFKIRFDALNFTDWDWLENNYQTYPHKPYEGKPWGFTTPEDELRKMISGVY